MSRDSLRPIQKRGGYQPIAEGPPPTSPPPKPGENSTRDDDMMLATDGMPSASPAAVPDVTALAQTIRGAFLALSIRKGEAALAVLLAELERLTLDNELIHGANEIHYKQWRETQAERDEAQREKVQQALLMGDQIDRMGDRIKELDAELEQMRQEREEARGLATRAMSLHMELLQACAFVDSVLDIADRPIDQERS